MSVMNGNCDYAKHEDKRIILKEFRKSVQDVLQPHHDDQYLLRWLKARNFDLTKSERMLRESLKFRKKIGADTILTSAYQIPEVFTNHNIIASLGFDKENCIVRLIMIGLCDIKGLVSSLRVVDLMKILVHILEEDLKMIQERKKKFAKVDERTTFILDFKDFNLKQIYDRTVINAGIQLITMYQDNYPETLKSAYLINVPSYFNWIFNIFKPFLNAVTLSKIKIYRAEEWKEDIFNIMDVNQIPGFMGGKLTDPDGDPKCNHLINWNSKISTSYYLKQTQLPTDDPNLKTTTVQQRATFEIPVHVEKKGSLLKWLFQTKDNNIRFGLFYKKDKKKHSEVLLPVQNIECQTIPERGDLICDKTGQYILHFDNSYSWLTPKQLVYKVELEDPEEIKNNNI